MKEWIFEIIASALFTGIISIILPDGKMSKTIKGVLAVFTALIIIKPVIGFDFSSFNDFSSYIESEIVLDDNYLTFIKDEKKVEIEKNCLKILENNGITGAELNIEYIDNSNSDLSVKKISVNLSDAVIKNENERINSIEKSADNICSYLKISREYLTFYE